ncbi:MAG: membrane protein insertion efficiency factor YidD [Alphaproteobacteria bacterium]
MTHINMALAALLRGMVGFYRFWLSPFMGRDCRFIPSCSVYAQQALTHHGPWRGGALALRRICRCHPWGGMGYDPVPKTEPNEPGNQ